MLVSAGQRLQRREKGSELGGPGQLTFFLKDSARKMTSLHLSNSLRMLYVLSTEDAVWDCSVSSGVWIGENCAGESCSSRLGLFLSVLRARLAMSGDYLP